MDVNAPLNVFAQLSMLNDTGEAISVSAENQIIWVDMPSVALSRSLSKQYMSRRAAREKLLHNVHEGLKYADLAVEFRVAKRIVARLRPQSRPNFLSRLLGYGPLELQPIPILLALLRL